eukprot:CAMPEP_0118921818 /NCGR_PEP_ID=MMETSP1169-20130426/977_1 /TAXON_ID=36882 /ORGANISM="Pyramimonas obovata, Strain CCMP722" /LENGTH=413 /DNA_ID=CAMNT_0006862609 /DNA_START=77 /DNA_END=1318 /DNA_ORIENTATION=+
MNFALTQAFTVIHGKPHGRANGSPHGRTYGRPRRPCVTVKASDNVAQTQSPDQESYYDILLIAPADVEDLDTLRANYRRLQKAYHPDVYADGGERSKLLNTAYATLIDPTKRMEYDRGIGARTGTAYKPTLQTMDGLVGPIVEGDFIAEETFDCSEMYSEKDAMCNVAGEDFEEAVTFIRQWAQTLAFGAQVPLPMPLQCDNIEDGARIAVISTEANRIVSMGEITFVVVNAMDMSDGREAPTPTVQVRRRVPKSAQSERPLPGEERIMKSFRKTMTRLRGEAPPRGLRLSGVFASLAAGAIGLIPWGSNESSADGFDAYYLRPEGAAPSGLSYLLQEEWAVLKSSTMEYMRFGGNHEKLRWALSDEARNEFEQEASAIINKGDEAMSNTQLEQSLEALQVCLRALRKQVPDL